MDVAGNYIYLSEYTEEPDYEARGGRVAVSDYLVGQELSAVIFGAAADTQPVDENQEDHGGNIWPQFAFLDFYNRIHVTPRFLDLGNIISVQEEIISVWNSYFVPRTLNDVTALNDTGVVLTEPAATPLIFAPLQEYLYEVTVGTEGPALVGVTYTFDFDVVDVGVEIIGVRIVAWAWEPNWINPVIERLMWNTDVIPSFDGSEQRIALRSFPRVEWEFTFDVQDAKRRTFENTVFNWGSRIWALPIWIDGEVQRAPLTSGISFIEIGTDGRDFHDAGLGIVIGPDGNFESFVVDTVESNGVTLSDPLVSTWPTGSNVYPARTARLLDPRATSRFTRNYARGLAKFRTVEEIERETLEETLYRDFPVLEVEPNWREAPEIDYLRKQAVLDFGTGRDYVDDEAELALPTLSWRWTMLTRDDADYFRRWLYSRAGRHKGVWVPTWCDDLALADTATATQLTIDFVYANLTYFALGDVHRRDIRIELLDGEVIYRRVTGPVVVDASTERMTLSQGLGILVEPEDVSRISWMNFVRLDADAIEMAWQNRETAEAVVVFKGARNEF